MPQTIREKLRPVPAQPYPENVAAALPYAFLAVGFLVAGLLIS